MFLQFVNSSASGHLPLTQDDLNHLETRYHFVFPSLLRDYYLKYNGCEIAECVGKYDDDLFIVTQILPIGGGEISLEDMLRFDRDNGIIQPHLIPFATTPLAGYYYFDAHTENVFLSYRQDENDFSFICAGIETFFQILNQTCIEQDEDNYIDITEIARRG